MKISADEVWISEENDRGFGGTTRLSQLPEAEGRTFDGLEAVKAFVKEAMDGGEYKILLAEDKVTVPDQYADIPEPREVHSDYQASLINSVYDEIADRDDVILKGKADDKDQRNRQAEKGGVTLKLSPYEYDIYAGVHLDDDADEKTVAEDFAEEYDEFRLVGWKRDTYYERRGARGQPIVNVYLRLPAGNRKELDNIVESTPQLEQVYNIGSLTYKPIFVPKENNQQDQPDVVLLTNMKITDSDSTGFEPDDDEIAKIPQLCEEHLSGPLAGLDNWSVHSLGNVVSLGGFKVAVGLVATDPNTLIPPSE